MLKTIADFGSGIDCALSTIDYVVPDFNTDIRESVRNRLLRIRERLDRTREHSIGEIVDTNTELSSEEIDGMAIRSDWVAIGSDLKGAMKNYAKQSN